jgi:hypothetical protein
MSVESYFANYLEAIDHVAIPRTQYEALMAAKDALLFAFRKGHLSERVSVDARAKAQVAIAALRAAGIETEGPKP